MQAILQLELKQLLANRLLLLVGVLLLGTIGFGVYNGQQLVNEKRATIAQLKAEEGAVYRQWQARADSVGKGLLPVGEWSEDPTNPINPGSARWAGQYAILPPADLALVSVGQSDIYPYYAKVSTRSKDAGRNQHSFENPFNLANGQFDLAFTLVFLLPLLIIALSYNLLSAEREGGTLKMMLSQPLQLGQVIGAKLVFRYGLVVGIAWLGIGLALAVAGAPLGTAAFPQLLLLVALYSAFWFALAFFVNVLGKSSPTNALLLVGAWLGFVLVIPSLANVITNSLHPVPSRVELVTALRDAEQRVKRDQEAMLTRFYQSHPQYARKSEKEPWDWRQYYREHFLQKEAEEKLATPVNAAFEAQLARQQALAYRYRFLSPALLLGHSLNEIAGTDTRNYLAFNQSVEDFYGEWNRYFKDKFWKEEKITAATYDRFPTYQSGAAAVAGSFGPNALATVAFGVLFAGLGGWQLSRRRYALAI
ncbi:MAG: DUF3526 domain-containing protein [Ferruginibacter sp.]|nr:DUF3526 domain-containing protein [Cytophagales bacterium]